MARKTLTLLRGPGLKKPNARGVMFRTGQIIPTGHKPIPPVPPVPAAPVFVGPDIQNFSTAVGEPIDVQLGARWNRGVPTGTFTIGSGVLPSGMVLESNGRLHGSTDTIETQVGLTVVCTNSEGSDSSNIFTWDVASGATAPVFVGPAVEQTAVVGASYSFFFSVWFTGTAPMTVTVETGTLPDGLVVGGVDSSQISGVPTQLQTEAVTLRLTNSAGFDLTTSFNFVVEAAPVFIGPDIANQNWTYDSAITPIETDPLFLALPQETFALAPTSGPLPDGVTVHPTTGQIAGTPVQNPLLGHWKMDEATGSVVNDSALGAKHGTLGAGQTLVAASGGASAGWLESDGSNRVAIGQIVDGDAISLVGINGGPRTITMWLALTVGSNANGRIICWGDRIWTFTRSGTNAMGHEISSSSASASGSNVVLTDDVWHFVACVVEDPGGGGTWYIDDVITPNRNNGTPGAIPSSPAADFTLLGWATRNDRNVAGKFADFRIYSNDQTANLAAIKAAFTPPV